MTDPIARTRELLAAATPGPWDRERQLIHLWGVALEAACSCTKDCARHGSISMDVCTAGKLRLAVNEIGPSLPTEWPDEWDDPYHNAMGNLADACEAKDAEIERLRAVVDAAPSPLASWESNGTWYTQVSGWTRFRDALAALSDTGGEET